MKNKTKITIEHEGKEPTVLYGNGIAMAIIDDADDDNHKVTCCICGNMSIADLLHLRDAAGGELVNQIEAAAIKNIEPEDMAKLLLRGLYDESDK